jgi:hypothetical protein
MKFRGTLTFVFALLLAATQTAGSCVDGVTPDCSDAAECGPTFIDAGEASAPAEGGQQPTNDGAAPSDAGEAGDAPDGGG